MTTITFSFIELGIFLLIGAIIFLVGSKKNKNAIKLAGGLIALISVLFLILTFFL